MAILNKKSMLFLLATTLLICSSHADDHLSSAGMEERAFTVKTFVEKIIPFIRSEYPKRIKKGLDFIKELDGSISTSCTKRALKIS
ncbi:hypothetical protein Tco_0819260 [Tanacetum coccineum]|uniref:Uncharacterized protein n=1 Tax=Tanacetum coccineum TaxID=301880 RepID=A0ABQ5A6Y3_9ASTR